MRLAAHSFGFVWHEPAATTVGRLAEAGFTAVELLAVPAHLDIGNDGGTAAACAAALARTRLEVVALDLPAHDYNLASLDADAAAFSRGAYVRLLELAAELGAGYATVHGGRRIGLFPPPDNRQIEALMRNFDWLCAQAQRRGVKLAIENIPISLLATAAEIETFLDVGGWNDVGAIYDVANALTAREDPSAGLAMLAERLVAVHASDTLPGRPGHDPIGTGAVDFVGLGALLSDFAGWGVIEVAAPDPLAALIEGRASLQRAGWAFDGTMGGHEQ